MTRKPVKVIKGKNSQGIVMTTVLYESEISYSRCQRCGRKLKNPVHMEMGYGPTCYKKMKSKQQRRLF